MLDVLDVAIRILAGTGFGALIGLERQWRARTAGLRTNALVSLGAALFVIMGAFAFDGSGVDQTRVAAQVVSGIGFLGAGVIWKQGASVSGLNTAATLWASAAVGALSGGGMVLVAAAGTLAVVTVNLVLRPVGRLLDRRPGSVGRERGDGVEYVFEVRCDRAHEVEVRARVFAAVHRPDLTVRSIAAADLPEGVVLITAVVRGVDRDDARIEAAIADLVPVPEVLGVRWGADDLAPLD